MLDIINKAAITVIPKEPFIKWVQSTDAKAAEISDEDILSNSQVYLVDASEDGDDPEKLIRKNFKESLIRSLSGGAPMEMRGPELWVYG